MKKILIMGNYPRKELGKGSIYKRIVHSERKEYVKTVLLNYLYYNIIHCRSRKIKIKELADIFDKLYSSFLFEEVLYGANEKFSKYSIHTVRGTSENMLLKIKKIIKEVCKKGEYKNMFHITGDEIVIDDGFSYSPSKEMLEIEKEIDIPILKRCLFLSRSYIFSNSLSEREKKIASFVKKHTDNWCGETVMEYICEKAIKNNKRPEINSENENIKISNDNYELGKLLAARFIYRCGKAWYRENNGYYGELLRNNEVMINGLDYADELRKEMDGYRNNINSKYIELANRFAFLLQTAKNNSTVYYSNYISDKKCLKYDVKPDYDEAFQIARNNYINSKIDTPYQSFLVNKDENGDIWLKDPGMDASVSISTMSHEEKKKIFRAKELLDRIVEKEQKKKECEELLHQYMLEQSSCRKRNIRYEVPFYYDTKWYEAESQSENKGYPKTLKK